VPALAWSQNAAAGILSVSATMTGGKKVVIAGVSGSLRPGSFTSLAVRLALEGAHQFGAEARFLELSAYQLPLLESSSPDPPGLAQWRADVASADGLILGTPDYHGSFSGVLKNALDFLDFPQTEGKMIGLIGVAGGTTGAFDALNGLRSVGRAMHSWVIPQQAVVQEASRVFSSVGEILKPEIEARLLEVGREVARFAQLHKWGRAQEFLDDWQKGRKSSSEGSRVE
jgi:FMN reductase